MSKKSVITILILFFPLFLEAENFLIITKSEYMSAISLYTSWRRDLGDSVACKTIEKIINLSGKDLPEKIRNFIIATNSITKFKYILLIGSYDDIPAREVQPAYNISSQYSGVWNVKFYTDQYYADLNGDWDSNGNGIYAEYTEDNISFSTDIFIGRIPFDNSNDIKDYLRRVIMFQQDERDYKKSAILAGAILFFKNEDNLGYPFIDGAKVLEYLKDKILLQEGFNTYTFYEQEGFKKSDYLSNYPLDEDKLRYLWQNGVGYINIEAHGGPYGVYRKIWNADDGNHLPENVELSTIKFVDIYSSEYLSNLKPSVIFANSCLTAAPEYDNLCKSILKRGAINYIGGTTVIYDVSYWTNEQSGGSSSFNYYFTKFLIKDKLSIGRAFYKTKVVYTNFYNIYDEYLQEAPVVNQITLLSLNLFGDPSVSFNIKKPSTDNVPPYISDFSPKMYETFEYRKIKFNFKIVDVFSGIDKTSIMFFIDADQISDFIIKDIDNLSVEAEYLLENGLPNGTHSYRIIASDKAANTTTNIVYFTINKKETKVWIYQFYCYPNPCYKEDENIKFYFEADEDCIILLKIYNIAGVLIKEYSNIPGYTCGNTVIWDKKNIYGEYVSSGIYIGVLVAKKNKESVTKYLKIAIIK